MVCNISHSTSMEANIHELYTVVKVQGRLRKLADKPCDVYSVQHLKVTAL